MKPLRSFPGLLLVLALGLACVGAEPPMPLSAAPVTMEASGNARDQFTLALRNTSTKPISVAIPAGLIATGRTPESRVIVLRAATALLPAQEAVDVMLPVAALSSKNIATQQTFSVTTATEPRLTVLLDALANQPDAPRPTAQLAVLGLLEDMSFAQWRQFAGAKADSIPTPAEVTQAIDALGLLRSIAPERTFALANDAELKARALRNPWCRAKAMAIYGLDLGDGAAPPDLRQLLHTQAGDNCPTCRQRALMQKPADIP